LISIDAIRPDDSFRVGKKDLREYFDNSFIGRFKKSGISILGNASINASSFIYLISPTNLEAALLVKFLPVSLLKKNGRIGFPVSTEIP
jgi:hypothetical protein